MPFIINLSNMKQILLTLIISLSFYFVQAQNAKSNSTNNMDRSDRRSDMSLGLSINPGLSLDGTDFVLGGEISLSKNLSNNLDATFATGYTHFFYSPQSQQGRLIPIKAGIRYALSNRIYVGAQAGVALSTTDGGAYFMYSPSIGWGLNKQFDIGLKYDHFSNEPAVLGLNLTYRFGL
jgi:hypothetical protein